MQQQQLEEQINQKLMKSGLNSRNAIEINNLSFSDYSDRSEKQDISNLNLRNEMKKKKSHDIEKMNQKYIAQLEQQTKNYLT